MDCSVHAECVVKLTVHGQTAQWQRACSENFQSNLQQILQSIIMIIAQSMCCDRLFNMQATCGQMNSYACTVKHGKACRITNNSEAWPCVVIDLTL